VPPQLTPEHLRSAVCIELNLVCHVCAPSLST
jgi:hypothetical protein